MARTVGVYLFALAFLWAAACTTGTGGRPDETGSQSRRSVAAQTARADDVDEANESPFPVCDRYGPAMASGRVGASKLVEASGVAVSYKNPGLIWAHNDSGDEPLLYAMKQDGAFLGTIRLAGVQAVDWEDLAVGPCGPRPDADECLYIGDIGDNGRRRTEAAVYRVPEPPVEPLEPFGDLVKHDFDRFGFTYPEGPQNAEGLAVAPDGSVYIFTKQEGRGRLYVFPSLHPGERVRLDYLGEVAIGDGRGAKITAFDIHRSGRRALIRTYLEALEWKIPDGGPIAWITSHPPATVPAVMEPQGEAIAYDPFTGGYIHISEGLYPQIYRVSCATPNARR